MFDKHALNGFSSVLIIIDFNDQVCIIFSEVIF
jgi:hypothetical protein